MHVISKLRATYRLIMDSLTAVQIRPLKPTAETLAGPAVKFLRRFWSIPLCGTLVIPLQTPEKWIEVPFGKKTVNRYTHSKNGLNIEVNSSASPIFFPFEEPVNVRSVRAEGEIKGLPKLNGPEIEEENDDLALRIGLVVTGERRISLLEKWFAPAWVKQLIQFAPDRKFGRVVFYSISQQRDSGNFRHHPMSKYFDEWIAQKVTTDGSFSLNASVDPELNAFGIWIQADGDNTNSVFRTSVKTLTLETPQ